ncbi:MAG TPA: hypothetical protein VHJ69_01845 [Gemmatimonadales bacterium]|nr:hypothetical protein [Gemmatimonadales bacterium]
MSAIFLLRTRVRLLATMIAGLLAASCGGGDGPTNPDPEPANLRVFVTTRGLDHGSVFQVLAGTTSKTVTVNGSASLLLVPGVYDVHLEGLPANCSVSGPDVVQATAVAGLVNQVQFRVECRAVTGVIEVTAQASGRDYDPNGFTVVVDDGQPQENSTTAYIGGAVWLEGIPPGSHQISLADLSHNCVPNPTGSFPVSVTAGGLTRDTTRVVLEFACSALTGDVRLITQTTGADLDPNGYTVLFDGRLLQYVDYYYYGLVTVFVGPNDAFEHAQVTPESHTYGLSDLAPNCTVDGANPKTVTVVLGQMTEVPFHVVCTDIP